MIKQWEHEAWEQYHVWLESKGEEGKLALKISTLLRNIDQNPYDGLGKPEPLKYDLKGWWSRRINQEHRLIYKVSDSITIILSCEGHYVTKRSSR